MFMIQQDFFIWYIKDLGKRLKDSDDKRIDSFAYPDVFKINSCNTIVLKTSNSSVV